MNDLTISETRLQEIEGQNVAYLITCKEKQELVRGYREHKDCDVALAQASAFAQYVSDHAKGAMVQAAQKFLSLEAAKKCERVIALAQAVERCKVSDDLVHRIGHAVLDKFTRDVSDDLVRFVLESAFKEMSQGLFD